MDLHYGKLWCIDLKNQRLKFQRICAILYFSTYIFSAAFQLFATFRSHVFHFHITLFKQILKPALRKIPDNCERSVIFFSTRDDSMCLIGRSNSKIGARNPIKSRHVNRSLLQTQASCAHPYVTQPRVRIEIFGKLSEKISREWNESRRSNPKNIDQKAPQEYSISCSVRKSRAVKP